MSDSAKFNLFLAASISALAVIVAVFALIPPPVTHSAVAVAYCAEAPVWPEIAARAAYVEDLATRKTLYQKNAEVQLPLDSLTKLMTVLVALDSLTTNESIEIPSEAIAQVGDDGLFVREVWKVKDLIDFTLMVSSNDGAYALAHAASQKRGLSEGGFVFLMNEKAKNLFMRQTYFTNSTGLDAASSTPGALGSALDVGTLLREIFAKHSDAFSGSAQMTQVFTSKTGFEHAAANTSTVPANTWETIISKTGSTPLAGGNLALIFEPIAGHPIAAVILGSTLEQRDDDMTLLIHAATNDLRRILLCSTASM